jgi:hypothetical protein
MLYSKILVNLYYDNKWILIKLPIMFKGRYSSIKFCSQVECWNNINQTNKFELLLGITSKHRLLVKDLEKLQDEEWKHEFVYASSITQANFRFKHIC